MISQLQSQLDNNEHLVICCHRNCVPTYTSKLQIKRHLKRKAKQTDMQGPSQPKRQRRCDIPVFIFQQHCLFFGLECNIVKDKKHPHRWRKASLCRTADCCPGKETLRVQLWTYVLNGVIIGQVRF